MNRSHRIKTLASAVALSLATLAGTAAAADRINVNGLQSQTQFDRFIVKYRSGTSSSANVAAARTALNRAVAQGVGGRALGVSHLRRLSVGAEVIRSNRKLDRLEAEMLMRQIAADPNVEYVEVDQIMQPLLTPNDTHYATYLWGLKSGVAGIKADQAWDTTNGSGVVVAVLDTGIVSHSDLNANVIAGYDMISDTTVAGDGNGRDSDPSDPGDYETGSNSSWHGTHVAGTIAAVGNNGAGVIGVAYGAKISPVRVLGRGGGYTSDIVDGITWASGGSVSGVPANANPAEVINMSLGGGGTCSSTYQNAINAAVGRGSTIVVAAGNSNANASSFTPASCNNVINVAAIGTSGNRASYSNYGSSIDVAAPGGDNSSCAELIVSTGNAGTQGPTSENYLCMAGTSMAAPHVAGVVALMQAAASTPLTPAQVESTLKSTLSAFPSSQSPAIGGGIVNAKAAVDAAAGGGGGPDPDPDPGTGTLTKGVPVTGLSASTGNSLNYTLVVPSGASNLTFTMSGGSGDADMYVKFGSAPTDSSYDCRPYLSGNAETCTFASPSAGTYHVRVKAYSSFSGASLVANYDTSSGGGGVQTYTNGTDVSIPDNNSTGVYSNISVSGRSGNAPNNAQVAVNIVHTYIGDLIVDLVAPDGTVRNLHNRSGGSADNINQTYTVNLSSEALNGTWRLRVRDRARTDTGYINSWSITF